MTRDTRKCVCGLMISICSRRGTLSYLFTRGRATSLHFNWLRLMIGIMMFDSWHWYLAVIYHPVYILPGDQLNLTSLHSSNTSAINEGSEGESDGDAAYYESLEDVDDTLLNFLAANPCIKMQLMFRTSAEYHSSVSESDLEEVALTSAYLQSASDLASGVLDEAEKR